MRPNRWRHRLLIAVTAPLVTVAATLVAVGTLASPAAATSTWTYDVITSQIVSDGAQRVVLRLPAVTLAAGERIYFNGGYGVSNGYGFNIMQGAQIRCQTSGVVARSVFTTRNATAYASGSARVHWLFTVPQTAVYTCELLGHALTSRGTGYALTVVSGSSTTYLGMQVESIPDGQEWRHTTGGTVPSGGSAYLLRKEWTAVTGASVGVDADVELTSNKSGGASGSSLTATLYVTQLNSAKTACTSTATHTYSQNKSISTDVHHDKVYFRIRGIGVQTASGCTRLFAIKVLIRVTSGNPVDLNGTATTHYSNGIAFSV